MLALFMWLFFFIVITTGYCYGGLSHRSSKQAFVNYLTCKTINKPAEMGTNKRKFFYTLTFLPIYAVYKTLTPIHLMYASNNMWHASFRKAKELLRGIKLVMVTPVGTLKFYSNWRQLLPNCQPTSLAPFNFVQSVMCFQPFSPSSVPV